MELELNQMDVAMPQLPPEMWEGILEKLDDSTDILNLFTAFPGLEGILENKKPAWLMDQVIPHLFHYLWKWELLFCRQVSRRWSRAVDNFMENHPLRKTYDYEAPITEQIWRPDAYRKYRQGCFIPCPLPATNYIVTEHFGKFLSIMEAHPSTRNPFVGRSVYIFPCFPLYPINPPEFWMGARQLVLKFGKDICFLRIRMHDVEGFGLWEPLQLLLPHLPNLKALEFNIPLPGEPESWICPQLKPVNPFQLPPLQYLRHLNIQQRMLPPFVVKEFIKCYAAQLSSFKLDAERCWQLGYSTVFVNLTKLSLNSFNREGFGVIQEFNEVLMTINCPKLICLELHCGIGYVDKPVAMEDEVIRWIKRFPHLQSLKCTGWPATKESKISPTEGSVIPLSSLDIEEGWSCEYRHELSYNFLRCFPNLQYLTVCYNSTLDRPSTQSFHPSSPLSLDELMKEKGIYKSNLWEMFPKIQEIHIESSNHRYTRDDYERSKRVAAPQ